MNQQQILDTVYHKLTKQAKRSYNCHDNNCIYYNDDGTKCAVGHLLPESEEAKQWILEHYNFMGVYNLIGEIQRRCQDSDEVPADLIEWATQMYQHRKLLSDLQYVHDTSIDTASDWSQFDFEIKIANLCQRWELKMPTASAQEEVHE